MDEGILMWLPQVGRGCCTLLVVFCSYWVKAVGEQDTAEVTLGTHWKVPFLFHCGILYFQLVVHTHKGSPVIWLNRVSLCVFTLSLVVPSNHRREEGTGWEG